MNIPRMQGGRLDQSFGHTEATHTTEYYFKYIKSQRDYKTNYKSI